MYDGGIRVPCFVRRPDHFYQHGHWKIDVRRSGEYEITLGFGHSDPPGKAGKAHFRLGGVHLTWAIAKSAPSCKFNAVALAKGWGDVEAWVELDKAEVLVSDVYIKCLVI